MKRKDKTGNELNRWDSVLVPCPNNNDSWNNEFVGTIKTFDDKFVIVEDSEGDCFSIEPERLEFYDEEKERLTITQELALKAIGVNNTNKN